MVDCSFGTIPYKLVDGTPYFLLLVDARYGHWTYPKGHAQGTETPLETALRELKEETGLSPLKILVHEPLLQEYSFRVKETGDVVDRRLEFTVVHVGDQDIQLQDSEVTRYQWMSYEEVCATVTHDAVRLNTFEALSVIKAQHFVE